MLCAIHSSIHQSWAVRRAPRPDCKAQHSLKDTTLPPPRSPFLLLLRSQCCIQTWQQGSLWFLTSVSLPFSPLHHPFPFPFLEAKQLTSIWLLSFIQWKPASCSMWFWLLHMADRERMGRGGERTHSAASVQRNVLVENNPTWHLHYRVKSTG